MGLSFAEGQPRRFKILVQSLLARAVAIVFPPTCLACEVLVRRQGGLCPSCWPRLDFIDEPLCAISGAPFAHAAHQGMIAPDVEAAPPVYSRARSAVLFNNVARLLAHRLKYSDRADLALPMAGWMVRAGADLLAECDIVVAVPLHRWRLVSRRYNQSAELARAVARLGKKPHGANLLVRHKATRQQVGLSEKARQRNVQGAFSVRVERQADIAGRKVLLIDDVLTTGATVSAATRALKRAGAAQVSVLTFARVSEPGQVL